MPWCALASSHDAQGDPHASHRTLRILLAATAVIALGAAPTTASADPWPRERHGTWGDYRADGHFCALGRSAAFRVSLDGTAVELRRFDPDRHGYFGTAGLTCGSDGYFYGAMSEGGPGQGGTVFRLSAQGELKILHAFIGSKDPSYAGQAYRPTGPLMQAADGSLYATVVWGGKWGYGGVYRVAPGKGFQQLIDFAGSQGQDTYQPFGALVQTPDGFLLGTGYDGGLHSGGTVYALIPIP